MPTPKPEGQGVGTRSTTPEAEGRGRSEARTIYLDPSGTPTIAIDVPQGIAGTILDTPDVSKLPGARVVAAYGLDHGPTMVRAGCVRAPSDRFVAGVEGVLFERATSLALRAAGLEPTELARTRGHSDDATGLYDQRLDGHTKDRTIGVAHLLTFVGSDSEALLCTAVCAEPLGTSPSSCNDSLDGFQVTGAHAAPPKPGMVARAVFFAADHPTPALAGSAALAGLVVAWILFRRPRPRP